MLADRVVCPFHWRCGEVGKLSVPSFSSCCWAKAPEASAAVIRPAAHSVRRDCLHRALLRLADKGRNGRLKLS